MSWNVVFVKLCEELRDLGGKKNKNLIQQKKSQSGIKKIQNQYFVKLYYALRQLNSKATTTKFNMNL